MQRTIVILVAMFLLFGCLGPLLPQPVEETENVIPPEQVEPLPPETTTPDADQPPAVKVYPLRVHFIDLAEIDDNSQAVLIQTANANILVDTGSKESYDKLREFLADKGVNNLNLVVTTSSYDDYSGALRQVLGSYEAGEIWKPKAKSYQDPEYEQLLKEQSTMRSVFPMQPGLSHTYDGMKITVLSETDPDQNNYAPVIRLDYGQTCMLLTSRLNTGGQRYLINYAKESLACDILQIPDSGLSESNTQLKLFLDTVDPQAVIISGGMYDRYEIIKEDTGRAGTLNIIKLKSLPTYTTYIQKTIIVSSDGKDYKIEYEE